MLDRVLLFAFSVTAAGLVVAASTTFSTDASSAVLYLLGAALLAGLAGRAWKRLAASIRARSAAPKAPVRNSNGL